MSSSPDDTCPSPVPLHLDIAQISCSQMEKLRLREQSALPSLCSTAQSSPDPDPRLSGWRHLLTNTPGPQAHMRLAVPRGLSAVRHAGVLGWAVVPSCRTARREPQASAGESSVSHRPGQPWVGGGGGGGGSDCCDQEHREKQLGEINCGRGRNMVRPQSINPEKMVSGPRGEAQRVCAPTGKELLHPPGSMWVMCAVTAESLLTGFQLR